MRIQALALTVLLLSCGVVGAVQNVPGNENSPAVAKEVVQPLSPQISIEESPRRWMLYAQELRRRGFHHKAQQCGREIIQVILDKSLASRAVVAKYYHIQAGFESDMYDFVAAGKLLAGALGHHAVHKKAKPSLNRVETLMVLANLARVLDRMDEDKSARELYDGKLTEALPELDNGMQAIVLVNKARFHLKLGEHRLAQEDLDEAWKLLDDPAYRKHPGRLGYEFALGKLLKATGKETEAEKVLVAAVDNEAEVHGVHSLQFVVVALELAGHYEEQKQPRKASSALERIRIIDEEAQFGPEHPLMSRLRAARKDVVAKRD